MDSLWWVDVQRRPLMLRVNIRGVSTEVIPVEILNRRPKSAEAEKGKEPNRATRLEVVFIHFDQHVRHLFTSEPPSFLQILC
jgi:N-formylglutamate amidohydrolase